MADISLSTNSSNSTINLDDEKLFYEIHRYSSYSTNYFPDNILVDCPSDQTSRWSANSNNPPQFLVLKLKRPAIVKRIKFGKFEKSHVCNIKKFRVFGGLEEKHLMLLLEGNLKNDNKPEVFNLRCLIEDGIDNFPILYIKIMPLLSWGPTFNFSIWYVELHGQDDPMYTSTSMKNYNKLREVEIVRLCLKHFRQQGYDAAFKALQEQTQVRLEHPVITKLHKYLVVNGDFEKTEEFVAECINMNLMDEYLNNQDYRHIWSQQQTESLDQPGNRGGHQLIIDANERLVYLYGGWDGFHDLSDLWVFDINNNSWALLCEQSEVCNGPTPRSCHKMIFDPVSENIFMLGRYLDNSIRTTNYIKSDFYLYDTRGRTWLQICDDTSQVGGPQLIYDHQMCIDADKRTIYVFGGKILTPRSVTTTATNEPEYSGLFSYHIATNTWAQILVDCHHPSAALEEVHSIRSRITHCMVFHNTTRKLYIYGGQRGKEDIDEFISYDVDTQAICILNNNNQCFSGGHSVYSAIGDVKKEPSPGYTLRATIDCERNEIYIFSSLSKIKDRRDLQHVDAQNSFWVYSLNTNKWSRVYTYRHNMNALGRDSNLEPCPRYAHQLIYDDLAKVHYLFGGNPGKSEMPQLRLDDFWILSLEKPKREEVFNHCRYLVRKLCYEEMARSEPIKAMHYLRTLIAEVIDHSNSEQLSNFHKLASLLFKCEDVTDDVSPKNDTSTSVNKSINLEITDKVVDFFTSTGCGSLFLIENDLLHKSDSDATNPPDDTSIESLDGSSTTSSSGIADLTSSYTQYRKCGGKRSIQDYANELKTRRSYLFNKIVKLMPSNMVQPEQNLSDFIAL